MTACWAIIRFNSSTLFISDKTLVFGIVEVRRYSRVGLRVCSRVSGHLPGPLQWKSLSSRLQFWDVLVSELTAGNMFVSGTHLPLSKHTPEAPGHESLLLLIVFFIYKEGMHRSVSPAVLAVLMKVVFPFTLFLVPVNISLCLTMICIMTAGYFVLQFASCYHFEVQLRTTLPLFLFAFFFPTFFLHESISTTYLFVFCCLSAR